MSLKHLAIFMCVLGFNLPLLAQDNDRPGADNVPEGQELVSIDFPEPTEIKDIIRAVALWTGKNVILGKGVNGKVQMISPRKVTKEEAYQAFLSALNVLGLTTVETGKVIKILPTRNALKGNLRIYQGTSWAPRTDKLITQIVPLKYIDAKQIQTTLSRIVSTNSMIAYQPTNTLIISDTGYKVRRILQIVELLDVAGQQPKVALVPIKWGDAKTISSKVSEILKASVSSKKSKAQYRTYRITVDERSNSVVIFGPPRTIQDVKELVKKFDFPVDDPSNQAAIRVRFLDYADAKKLATTLSSLAQGANNSSRTRTIGRTRVARTSSSKANTSSAAPVADLGGNVKITADESSNSLLITGSRSAYETINTIVRKLDRRRAQVYVEADILDVNLTNNINFGTSLIMGQAQGNSVRSYGWQGKNMAPIVAASDSDSNLDTAAKLGIAEALGRDFTIGVLASETITLPGLGTVRPGGLISMLKADGNTRVLASPHLLTSNNETAKIVVGNKIFYKVAKTSAAVGAGAIEDTKDVDADLSLEMKPNVSHSGDYVTLKLDLEANEGSIDANTSLPNISKRQTSQLVTVKNGQTAVISGLVKRREEESFQKIPILGDLPILGWLFRNSVISKATTSLMIFLTPHVVFGANDLSAIYQDKVNERDRLLKSAFGFDEDDEFYRALPSKEAGTVTAKNNVSSDRDEILNEMKKEDEEDANSRGNGLPSQDLEEPTPVPVPIGGGDEGGVAEPMDVDPPEPVDPPEVDVPEPMDPPELPMDE